MTLQPNMASMSEYSGAAWSIHDSGNRERLPDFEGDNRDARSFLAWCSLWLMAAWRVSKPGALLFMFSDWRQLPLATDAVQCGGWVWRGIVPWNKTEATRPQRGRPRAQCEYVVFATRGPHKASESAPCIPGFFTCPTPRERLHITEKPVPLIRKFVQLVPLGGIVCDPFTGSGAHGEAVIAEGRRFVGVELVPEIAATAAKRIRTMQGVLL